MSYNNFNTLGAGSNVDYGDTVSIAIDGESSTPPKQNYDNMPSIAEFPEHTQPQQSKSYGYGAIDGLDWNDSSKYSTTMAMSETMQPQQPKSGYVTMAIGEGGNRETSIGKQPFLGDDIDDVFEPLQNLQQMFSEMMRNMQNMLKQMMKFFPMPEFGVYKGQIPEDSQKYLGGSKYFDESTGRCDTELYRQDREAGIGYYSPRAEAQLLEEKNKGNLIFMS